MRAIAVTENQQQHIMQLSRLGHTVKDIADRLGLARGTVSHYRVLLGVGRTAPQSVRIATSEPWMAEAACRTVDPELFYPPPGQNGVVAAAKSICRSCPVQLDCLRFAVDNREPHGIWGGLSANERRRLRNKGHHEMKTLIIATTLAATALFAAPTANAYPWWMGNCYGGNSVGINVGGWGGGYCDGPPVNPAGDHYHCESAPFYSACGWRNAANAPIGMPAGIG